MNRLAGALVLLGVVCFDAAPARADSDPDVGKLLIADKRLRDPNFVQTVVLIITHDEDGTVGLVLNREGDVPISRLLRGVKDASKLMDTAFEGGPVEPKSVLALYRSRSPQSKARRITGDVYALLDQADLEDVFKDGAGRDQVRFYLGFAGWGPGQLEAEMDAGAWRVTSGNGDKVFDPEPDTLWDRMNRTLDTNVVRNRVGEAPSRGSVALNGFAPQPGEQHPSDLLAMVVSFFVNRPALGARESVAHAVQAFQR